jgi:ACDE family multidrug resistance protein
LYRDTNLQVILAVTLTGVLGVASITTALPKIAQQLDISAQAVGALLTVFTFPGVLLTPILGVLADQLGRKKVLVPSLMLFGIAGAGCAFAREFGLLLVLRFLQGVGAASLGWLTVTIIGDLYSGAERITAIGYNASVVGISAATYPTIGGALAIIGWYCPFILALIAIPVGFLVLFRLRNPEPKNQQAFMQYLTDAWKNIIGSQAIGLLATTVLRFIILYGPYLTYFPLWMEDSFNASPLTIGLIMSSMTVAMALTSSQVGRLVKVYPERTLIKAASVLYASALIIIPIVPNPWLLLIPAIIFGIAQGINIASIPTLLAGLAPVKQRAALMSISGMVMRLGQTLGPLLTGIVVATSGIGGAFYAGVGFAIVMFAVVVVMIK